MTVLCDTALSVFACFIQYLLACLYLFMGEGSGKDSAEIDFVCVHVCKRLSFGISKTVDHAHY